MSPSLLSLEQISFSYNQEGRNILNSLNLNIREGDFVLLKGKSGGGKSTLLKLVCRLLEKETGTILYKGKDISRYAIPILRQKLNYLPQLPVLIPGSIEENLSLPFRLHAGRERGKTFNLKEAQQLLEAFLLPFNLSEQIQNCSVGEKQRLCTIRSLLLEPDVLLLDEPTASLDTESAHALLGTLFRINKERKQTILLVSHQKINAPADIPVRYCILSEGILREVSDA